MNVTTLLQQLTDPDRDLRTAAAIGLGASRDPEVVAPLVARLGQEPDSCVRDTLTWAVVQHADAARPAIVEALRSDDPATRAQAAHVISKIADPTLSAELAPVIADADPTVAIKGYRAAAASLDPAVVPALIARLGDGDGELQDALGVAFAQMGGLGVPELIGALAADSAAVRRHAADVLGHVGSPEADAAVAGLTGLLADADAEVRMSAVSALRELDPELIGVALEQAKASDDAVVRAIASAPLREKPEYLKK